MVLRTKRVNGDLPFQVLDGEQWLAAFRTDSDMILFLQAKRQEAERNAEQALQEEKSKLYARIREIDNRLQKGRDSDCG